MSQPDERAPDAAETQGIPDDQLPDDLNPDENPMAGGLDAGETVDDLLTGGKSSEEGQQRAESEQQAGSRDGNDGAS